MKRFLLFAGESCCTPNRAKDFKMAFNTLEEALDAIVGTHPDIKFSPEFYIKGIFHEHSPAEPIIFDWYNILDAETSEIVASLGYVQA